MGRQEETAENDDYTSDFDDLDAEYKQEEQAVSWTSQLISTCKSTIKTMG